MAGEPTHLREVDWAWDGDRYCATYGHFTVSVSRTDEDGYSVQAAGVTLRRLSPDVPDGQRRAVATLRQMLAQALSELPADPDRAPRMDADDVIVDSIEPVMCPQCSERPVTHRVILDLRAAGTITAIEEMCQPCAAAFALSLRASLPPPTPGGVE